MSIMNNARSYADTAVGQSRSAVVSVPERLGALSSGAQQRATSALADSAGLLLGVGSLARRQAFASLGASDALVASITKRSSELPADVRQVMLGLVGSAVEGVKRANQLAEQAQERVSSVTRESTATLATVARTVNPVAVTVTAGAQVETRLAQAMDAFDKFAARGEQIGTDLRHDPVVTRLVEDADEGVEKAANRVTSLAQKVRARAAAQAERERAATTATPVRPTPAARVPAHTTTAANTPPGEAPVSVIPTHRAAAEQAEIRRAAASKAAETRKQNAAAREQEAQARSAAAQRAAETRKQNAEEAAAKRKATALKAAATRKEKAETRRAAALKAAATRKENATREPATTVRTPRPRKSAAAAQTTA
jgi:hypothetical protein